MKVFNQSDRIYHGSVQILPRRFTELPDDEAKMLLAGWGHEIVLNPGGGDAPVDQSAEVAALNAKVRSLEMQNKNLQAVLSGSKPEAGEDAPTTDDAAPEKVKGKPGPKPKDKAE